MSVGSIWDRLREAADTDIPRADVQGAAERLVWGTSVRWRALRQDSRQVIRYGLRAPRLFESVLVDPRQVSSWVSLGEPLWRGSGLIRGGTWHESAEPIETNATLRYARMRFVDRMDWEEIYEQLVAGRGAPTAEMMAVARLGDPRPAVREAAADRLRWFDELFSSVSRSRRLEARSSVAGWRFREHGGVCMHFGLSGRPIFGARGNHRFAIAYLLQLSQIPVVVGLVHGDVARSWRDTLVQPT